MTEHCPLHCIKSGCAPDPDFLETHGAFVLTFAGLLGGFGAALLTYFLKSRCRRIKVCCIECDRDPIVLKPEQVSVEISN